jgi:hypothetical protein
MRSYHQLTGMSLGIAFAVMVILRLGAVIPQGPGNVGTYNLIAVNALLLFGVPVATAKRFSLILWAAITLPLLVAGFIAVAITGARIGELQGHARAHMQRGEPIGDEDETSIPIS